MTTILIDIRIRECFWTNKQYSIQDKICMKQRNGKQNKKCSINCETFNFEFFVSVCVCMRMKEACERSGKEHGLQKI